MVVDIAGEVAEPVVCVGHIRFCRGSSFPEKGQPRDRETTDYLQSIPASSFEGAAEREVDVPMGRGKTVKMTGAGYLTKFLLPNFYFHVTTAHALLRKAGVKVGKLDYLGKIG